MPAFPVSDAPGSRKVAKSSTTIDVDRGCFACMLGGDDGRTLFIVANRYSGTGASDGIVLTQRVDARSS